jgi:hypothetical protein
MGRPIEHEVTIANFEILHFATMLVLTQFAVSALPNATTSAR